MFSAQNFQTNYDDCISQMQNEKLQKYKLCIHS